MTTQVTVPGSEGAGRADEFWDPVRETMPPAEREKLILDRVQAQLRYAYTEIPFYRAHYERHGFHPDQVRSLADFTTRVPVVTKKMLVADQQANPPFGSYAGVDRADIARVHGSSGTSGAPTLYGISRTDWLRSEEVCKIALWSAGVRPRDIVQISFPFGLFLGGWGLLQACEFLGAGAFPVGSLMPTDQQLGQMLNLRIDALVATPSYALHLGRRAVELGLDMRSSALRTVIVAGEPGGSTPEVRDVISRDLGGPFVIDLGAGASSEMHPFYANVGCRHTPAGVHLVQDENYTEVVDRDDPNVAVPVGTSGAVVATHLWRESQPMIRFWLGDEGVLDDSPCACGRTYPRLPRGVYGRLDDMLLVRGANVYPSAVEAVLRDHEAGGSEYRIVVERRGDLDELRVELETDGTVADAARADLEARLKDRLMVRTGVRFVPEGTFEPQVFKARRVIDHRG
ncbi:phenylacetate--CoA ligase (plasmid) [Pseudonocardia sp. EC080610-09]|uniref:phenylacetate--CoA ligase family protein n=1 Tax=unclassified Pseudonocardia TaxID=2619320 RepID=UPI000705F8F1|nr:MULTISPECIES: phenylacetate--CoA ligase family protein [unclassified Pseudonocardia]ALL79370.1 phenylacetate--CoA ligase [Pseudonocardia sp. EC080610-09]ALL85342.1 phenylacetate--CoA ligase [Pseudonocardia sp. EC080619-01]